MEIQLKMWANGWPAAAAAAENNLNSVGQTEAGLKLHLIVAAG